MNPKRSNHRAGLAAAAGVTKRPSRWTLPTGGRLAAALLTLVALVSVGPGAWTPARAQQRDNEVSTTLNKTLSLTAADLVKISNRYGPVEITATTGNTLTVVMTATAWASSKGRAEALLERIGLIYEREGTDIRFVTEIESRSGMNWSSDGAGYRISVKVTMPERNELVVTNRYGNTYFMDEVYKGRVTVEQLYGNLKGGRLDATRCSLTVRYGKVDLEGQADGYMKVAYGSGRVRHLGRVFLDVGYSRLDVDNADDVELDSDYDNLSLGRVRRLEGSANYSGLQIERLEQRLQLSTKYVSGFRIDRVADGFELIDLKGGYSSYTLDFDPAASFDYSVELKRGNLRYPSEGFDMSRYDRGENDQQSTYTGRRGAASKGRVLIEGSYTNVRFGVIGLPSAPRSSSR